MDIEKLFLLHNEMIVSGIHPYDNVYHSINNLLQNCKPDEARKLRRKFRKLWRNLLRKEINRNKTFCKNLNVLSPLTIIISKRVGKGAKAPSRKQKKARRNLVKNDFLQKVQKQIEPRD